MGLNHKEASSPIGFISNIKVKPCIIVMVMLPHEHHNNRNSQALFHNFREFEKSAVCQVSVKVNPLGNNSHLIYPYFYIMLWVFFYPVLISQLCTTSAKAVEACI